MKRILLIACMMISTSAYCQDFSYFWPWIKSSINSNSAAGINGNKAWTWVQSNSNHLNWVVKDWSNSVARTITSAEVTHWNSLSNSSGTNSGSVFLPGVSVWGKRLDGTLDVLPVACQPQPVFWQLNNSGTPIVQISEADAGLWGVSTQGQIIVAITPVMRDTFWVINDLGQITARDVQ